MTIDATYRTQVETAFEACCKAMEASAEAADADAGFDAGEFSGPAHAEMLERQLDQIAESFGFPDYGHLEEEADRFGFGPHSDEPGVL